MKLKLLFIFFLLMPMGLSAQIFLDGGTIAEWSSHPFYYKGDSSDIILNPSFNISFEKENFSMEYSGDIYAFQQVRDRSFYYHSAAIDIFNDKMGIQLHLDQRINKDAYSYFDYLNYGISMKIIWNTSYFHSQLFGKLGRYEYKELPEFNNWKLQLNFRASKRIFSKTTLIVNSSLIQKNYSGTSTEEQVSAYYASVTNDAMNVNGVLSGPGGGKHGSMRPGFGDGYVLYQQVDYPSVTKGYLNIRLAQSLRQRLGLALYGEGGWVISGDSRLLSGPGSATATNDIFDLSLGYNEFGSGLELTYVAPNLMTFKVGYHFTNRDYINEGIFENDTTFLENELRSDDIQRIWFQSSYSIYPEHLIIKQLDVIFMAEYFINKSNSYWYDFKGSDVSIGINVGL